MSFMNKLLNRSNSYKYYKENYDELKAENKKLKKENKKISAQEKKIKALEKSVAAHNELFNMIFIESNFQVGGNLRKLQSQTFEMLKFVVSVCEEYGFTYWLDYGTLIGAVRHQGFIPWDDEADVAMPRNDYEQFIKIIEDEVAKYPQLENVELRMGVAKLRHVNYTGIPAPCGQFVQVSPLANVDIHPVDYYDGTADENGFLKEYTKKEFKKQRKVLREKLINKECDDFTEIALIQGEKMNIVFEEADFMGSPIDGTVRHPMLVSDIFPLEKITFEGVEFNCPKNPINYLNAHYSSDLMKIPKDIRNHNRVDLIRRRIPDEQLDDAFDKVLTAWKSVNSK